METDKSYSELKEDASKLIKKWQPLLDKCGHLEDLDEKLLLVNTLENLRNKAMCGSGDYILPDGETLNVVNQTGTKRMVVTLLPDGDFHFIRQHKDWIDD